MKSIEVELISVKLCKNDMSDVINRKQIEKWLNRVGSCSLTFDSSPSLGWKHCDSYINECCNLIDLEYSYGFYLVC